MSEQTNQPVEWPEKLSLAKPISADQMPNRRNRRTMQQIDGIIYKSQPPGGGSTQVNVFFDGPNRRLLYQFPDGTGFEVKADDAAHYLYNHWSKTQPQNGTTEPPMTES